MKNMEVQLEQIIKTLSDEALLDNIKSIHIDLVQASPLGSDQNELSNEESQIQEERTKEEDSGEEETKYESIDEEIEEKNEENEKENVDK